MADKYKPRSKAELLLLPAGTLLKVGEHYLLVVRQGCLLNAPHLVALCRWVAIGLVSGSIPHPRPQEKGETLQRLDWAGDHAAILLEMAHNASRPEQLGLARVVRDLEELAPGKLQELEDECRRLLGGVH